MRTLLNKIRKLLKDKRTRRFWSRTVSFVAALVVFVTTYALVLPAITMERQAYCGMEAHQHTDDCFERQLVCTIPESPGHHHDESCYTMRQEYSCTLEEHVHEEWCYDEDGNLICEIPEHSHEEGTCWQEVPELTCTLEESDGHQHGDACYENVLVCGKEVHTHSEACYENPDELLETAAVATTQEGTYGISSDEGFDGSGTDGSGDSDGSGDEIGWTDSDEYGNAARSDAALSDDPSTGLTDSDNAANSINAAGSDTAELDAAGADAMSEEAQQDLTSGGISEEEDRYVPQLDPLAFDTALNKHTGIYYYHVREGETVEDSSLITEWEKVEKNTELGPNDLLRVYLSYTIPAGSLNETNPTAVYRLPASLHLTDDQVNGINAIENGIAAAYIDYNTLTVTDPDNYHRYLGAEAVEGTRTPDQTPEEYLAQNKGGSGSGASGNQTGQEFISAIVRAQNVYDTEGIYGEKGTYLGQDLIFTFSPYTIEKNQHTYDASGQPTRAGEKIRGWFAIDFNLTQVDLDEPYIEEVENIENIERIEAEKNRGNENAGENTGDENTAVSDDGGDTTVLVSREFRTANIVFVEKDTSRNLDEISASIKVVTAENYERVEVNPDDAENIENVENSEDNDEDNGEEQPEENAEGIEEDLTGQEVETEEDASSADSEDKSDADAPIMPAISFEDSIRVRTGKPAGVEDGSAGSAAASAAEALPRKAKVIVRVEADEGTFPAGTTMVLSAVEDLDAVAETVKETVENGNSEDNRNAAETEEKNPKTYGFQAVDISFRDADGNEIEPVKPVRVALTSEIVEQIKADKEADSSTPIADPVVVHVDDVGNAQKMELIAPEEIEPAQGKTEEEFLEEMEKETAEKEAEEDEATDAVNKTEIKNVEILDNSSGKRETEELSPENEETGGQITEEHQKQEADELNDGQMTNPPTGENNGSAEEPTVFFETDSFSVYAIVYTVDFWWEVNGKMYEFSIPGGGFVSFTDLVEILGIAKTTDDQENEDAASDSLTGEAASVVLDVEASADTKEFVENVENIVFSAPHLMNVCKVENESTVGQLKESLGLECEYSGELTEEQIILINNSIVDTGDWALISLRAFDSEEYLTVTMKTGEVFRIKVTDARDPYNISGKQFSIINRRNGDGAWHALKNAANPQGNTDRGNYLQATTSSSVTSANDGNEYCDIGSTVWTFEFVETDDHGDNYYRISCNGQYLSIDPSLTSKTETPRKNETGTQHPDALTLVNSKGDGSVNDGTRLKVVKNDDGTYMIQNANGLSLWNYNGVFWLSNPTNPSDNEANDSNARMHLAIPENPQGEHKAEMISAASLEDGQKILVYQRIYQGNDVGSGDTYKYYAIDGTGTPVQVYQNGDSIYWKGNASVEWTLTEIYDNEGHQTGYYTLYNEATGTYLTPKGTAGSDGSRVVHKLSDFAGEEKNLSISLPGMTNNEYVSSIACWDYTANVTYGVSITDDPTLSISTPELLRSQPFYFASREPVVQKSLTRVETVDSASKGITITMYDFDGEAENTRPTYNTTNYIPARLKFMDEIMGNELWTQGAYDPYFVTRYLEDNKDYPKIADNPTGKRYWSGESVIGNSLRQLFENTDKYNGQPQVKKTEDVNHLFIKSVYDATGYFHYSCFENAAYLNGSDFEVYDQLATGTDTNNYAKRGNFWPYNEPDTSRTPAANQYDTDLNPYGNNSDFPRANEDVYYVNNGNAPNYYFGMIMEAKFNQNQDGYSDHGDPMIFEFNGDDDLWIYIDEVLVLDIGGVHDAFRGKINFQTGLVQVFGPQTSGTRAGETTYIKEQYWQAHKFPDGSDWTDRNDSRADIFFTNDGVDAGNNNAQGQPKLKGTYKDFTTHNFKMFYMERGAGASQLEMTFNLPVLTGSQFRVKKEMEKTQTGEAIQTQFADAAFYYEAYVKENGEFKKVTRKYLADHSLGAPVYDNEENTEVVWKSDNLQETKFELKPGYTAIFPAVDDSVEWYVVEVEPETESHMLDNYAVTNSDPEANPDAGVKAGAQSAKKSIKVRNIVSFENKPDDRLVNELQIKKRITGRPYNENDSFEYRIFLENTEGELIAYSLGEYYQIDAQGRYVYFKDGRRILQSENPAGPYTYTYENEGGNTINVVDAAKPRYAEHTSVNGSIANIQDGDTIIIKGLLEGTDFFIYERTDYDYMTKDGSPVPEKYTFVGTEITDAYTRIPEVNRPDYPFGHLYDQPGMNGVYKYNPSEYELTHAASGAIIQEKDAKVLVKNNGDLSFDIEVKKNWPEESDDFSMNDLTADSKVIFTLRRYKLETRHGSVQLIGTTSVKSGDTMSVDASEKVNPKYAFVKSGKIYKTVEYLEMNDGSITITDLPVGTYSIYCYDDVDDYDMTSSSGATTGISMSIPVATVTVSETTPAEVSINSEYARQRGSLLVAKHLSGDLSSASNLSLTYKVQEGETVVATGNMTYSDFTDGTGMVEIPNLPTGIYTVTETVNNDGDKGEHSPGSQEVHVTKNGEVWATFVGDYPEKKIPVTFHFGYSPNQGTGWRQSSEKTYNLPENSNINAVFLVKECRYYSGEYPYGTTTACSDGVITASSNNTDYTVTPIEKSVTLSIPPNVDHYDYYIKTKCDRSDWVPSIKEEPSVISSNAGTLITSPRRMNAARKLSNTKEGTTLNDVPEITQSITPATDLPALTSEQEALQKYVIDDDWSLTVEMGKTTYTLKTGDTVVGSGTVTTGINYWDAVLENEGIISEDINGDAYYYYIAAVSEQNVPEGMTPMFDMDGIGNNAKPLITSGAAKKVLSVSNTLPPKTGSLNITKEVAVNGTVVSDHSRVSPADGTYTFTVTKKDDPGFAAQTVTLTITNGLSTTQELPELEAGTYIVTENETTNGTTLMYIDGQAVSGNNSSKEITVVGGATGASAVSVTFTNNIGQASIEIVKVDENDVSKHLPGAVFQMYRLTSGGQDQTFENDAFDVVGEGANARKTGPFTVTNGELTVNGLTEGSYHLHEMIAPAGYIITSADAYFSIDGNGTITLTDQNGVAITTTTASKVTFENGTMTVKNEPGAALPASGGPGTRLYLLLGGALIAIAGVLLARRRRIS